MGDTDVMEPLLWLSAPFVITAVVGWWIVRRRRPLSRIEQQEVRRRQLRRIEAVLGPGADQ